MINDALKEKIMEAIAASHEAGNAIMKVYAEDFEVMLKADRSPLTIADQKANTIITDHLKKTGYPILSEEGKEIAYNERKNWEKFWMVDPLDGTKEFIKRNGEFTVNIALMQQTKPIYGVIYVPATGELYFGGKGEGSFKMREFSAEYSSFEELLENAVSLPEQSESAIYRVIGSRSHMSPETEAHFEEIRKNHPKIEVVSKGSSLKLCMIAEGAADEYPRFAPTMEWDTAAGQAIVEGSGKRVIHYKSGKDLMYNKENLLNDWFVAKSE